MKFYFFAGFGRFKNPDYRIFLALLKETRLNNNEENKVNINLYMIEPFRGFSDYFIQILSVSLFNDFILIILQKRLGLYDFSFHAWPVDYHWDESKAEYVLNLNFCYLQPYTEEFERNKQNILLYSHVMLTKIQNIII